MNTLLSIMPWVASVCGVVMIVKALRLGRVQRHSPQARKRLVWLLGVALAFPALAQAQTADLKTAVEAGNGIIMYICGTLAAIGLVTAGIAVGTGRHAIAKWALGGTLICGLAFPIVKSIWSNVGMTAPDVSTFTP